MKKIICLTVCLSLNLLAAAGFSDAAYFDMGQLSIKNKDTFNRSKYACVVHHWSESHVHQEKGFVGAIMKRDDSEAADLRLLRTCRGLAVQLQDEMCRSSSSPLSILREITQKLGDEYSLSIESLAVIIGRQLSVNGVCSVFVAKGRENADVVNFVPQLGEVQELDSNAKPYELHLPEAEDAPDAPVVLWKAAE